MRIQIAAALLFLTVPALADDARWQVIPAVTAPVTVAGTPYMFAWRLDRLTGALEMCTYDPGGWNNPATKTPAPEALTCTLPRKPGP